MSKRVTVTVAIIAVALVVPVVVLAGGLGTPVSRNVILLIDDGAGYNHHEAGSLYDTGRVDGEAYAAFPFTAAVTTHSYGDVEPGDCDQLNTYDPQKAWSDFAWVLDDPTDSAAAATAMATGQKAYDAAIGVDCWGNPAENLVEVAERLGKATGVVTTVPFSHATPAGFVAHEVQRDEFVAIARDMVNDSATDVIMGGGHPGYGQTGKEAGKPAYKWIGEPEWNGLVAGTAGGDADGDGTPDPWTLVQAKAEFQALATGDTPERVFGVAQVRRTMQEDRADLTKVWEPYEAPLLDGTPTLAEMTRAALNVVDDDPDGFLLVIEGGATDWASHDSQFGLMLEEELDFDRAVEAVLAWVDAGSTWGETMVIVTSDHETGYLTGPGSGWNGDVPAWNPLVSNGEGVMPGYEWHSVSHTNSLVPIHVKGDSGRLLRTYVDGTDPVRGPYIDNTDIHTLIVTAMGAQP